jgi:hypothetical protein
MGVFRLTSFLESQGILPRRDDGDGDVNDVNATATCLIEPEVIPPGSTLAIDGNGLAHYLFEKAYLKFFKDVLATNDKEKGTTGTANSNASTGPGTGGTKNAKKRKAKKKKQGTTEEKGLSEEELVWNVLPVCLPLDYVNEEARLYFETLTTSKHNNGMHIQMFLDGNHKDHGTSVSIPGVTHDVKHAAHAERATQREKKWAMLSDYCNFGVLPGLKEWNKRHHTTINSDSNSDNNNDNDLCIQLKHGGGVVTPKYLLDTFPGFQPLMMDQMVHAANTVASRSSSSSPGNGNPSSTRGTIKIIQCQGEADPEVARASLLSTIDNPVFALGQDSDYLIFGFGSQATQEEYFDNNDAPQDQQVHYVPFHCLHLGKNENEEHILSATVLTRRRVASMLGLADETAMIELALLLGNDYTSHLTRTKKGYVCKDRDMQPVQYSGDVSFICLNSTVQLQ